MLSTLVLYAYKDKESDNLCVSSVIYITDNIFIQNMYKYRKNYFFPHK